LQTVTAEAALAALDQEMTRAGEGHWLLEVHVDRKRSSCGKAAPQSCLLGTQGGRGKEALMSKLLRQPSAARRSIRRALK